jgi:hypothetical protein
VFTEIYQNMQFVNIFYLEKRLETVASLLLLVFYFVTLSVSEPYIVTATPTCLLSPFSVTEYVAVILSCNPMFNPCL